MAHFSKALEPHMQKYLRILKSNFKSQHANKNNRLPVVGGWLPGRYSRRTPFDASQGRWVLADGWVYPQIKQKALDASTPPASRATSNNLENMLRLRSGTFPFTPQV